MRTVLSIFFFVAESTTQPDKCPLLSATQRVAGPLGVADSPMLSERQCY